MHHSHTDYMHNTLKNRESLQSIIGALKSVWFIHTYSTLYQMFYG